jgi:hypothetical protein
VVPNSPPCLLRLSAAITISLGVQTATMDVEFAGRGIDKEAIKLNK